MTTVVTHNGIYHADDVFAVATLLLMYPDLKVVRTRSQEIIDKCEMAVDVGVKYNPEDYKFDHHQLGGAGVRENGIPYASFGLVWKEFGAKVSGGVEEAQVLERNLVIPIDAHDNGVDIAEYKFDEVREYTIGDFLASFVIGNESMIDLDRAFNISVDIAKGVIEREILKAKRQVKDWKEVREIYNSSTDKKLVILPRDMSWKRVLVETEAQFVVSIRPDGRWQVRTVPDKVHGMSSKKLLPDDWAGQRDEELVKISGVKDAVFCHRNRFLVISLSKEGALELAKKALNA